MPRRKSRKQLDKAREWLRERLAFDSDVAALYREMSLIEGLPVPVRSTVYRWAAEFNAKRREDESGPWTLGTDETGRPALMLRVAGALAIASRNRRLLTHSEAEWVARVAGAFPSLQPNAEKVDLANEDIARGLSLINALPELTLWSIATTFMDASEEERLGLTISWGRTVMHTTYDALLEWEDARWGDGTGRKEED